MSDDCITALANAYNIMKISREKTMFEDEMKDLEIRYKKELLEIHRDVEDTLPSLLMYMKAFVKMHERNEEVQEKLDVLLAKMGRQEDE